MLKDDIIVFMLISGIFLSMLAFVLGIVWIIGKALMWI